MGCQSVTERCWKNEAGPAKAYQAHCKAGEPDIRRKIERMVVQPRES